VRIADVSDGTAKTIATSLQQDIVDGRMTFEEAMEKYTEDRGPDGKVNPPGGGKPGQYSFRMEDSFVPEFKEAGRTTPVGKLAPQPIETMFGYHLIRRDR
jgi:parvulin-like peptidyl-prolyl isomerase